MAASKFSPEQRKAFVRQVEQGKTTVQQLKTKKGIPPGTFAHWRSQYASGPKKRKVVKTKSGGSLLLRLPAKKVDNGREADLDLYKSIVAEQAAEIKRLKEHIMASA